MLRSPALAVIGTFRGWPEASTCALYDERPAAAFLLSVVTPPALLDRSVKEALANPLRASALFLICGVGRELRLGACQDAHVQ
jgi:hypothetical protein